MRLLLWGHTVKWCVISCSPLVSREDLFRSRLQQVLRGLAIQFPSLLRSGDFWRQTVVSYTAKYVDENPQVWVRLWEDVTIFYFEKNERFYQAEVGIINQRKRYIICPDDLGLVTGDHVLVGGNSLMITEHAEMAGVCKLTVEQQKSTFIMPGRNIPVYRQFSFRARIA